MPCQRRRYRHQAGARRAKIGAACAAIRRPPSLFRPMMSIARRLDARHCYEQLRKPLRRRAAGIRR